MQKIITEFVTVFVLLLSSVSALAQKKAEKYVVFIFEDTRYYSENGKTSRQSENYYWIAKVDSLFNNGSLYPLYLPVMKNKGAVVLHNESVYLSSLSNGNGLMRMDESIQDYNSYSYPLIKLLDENKIKKQSIKLKHKSLFKHPLQRKKEVITIYFVPVLGLFDEGLLNIDGQKFSRSYYAIDGENIEAVELEENEMLLVSVLDCSLVDFSAFIDPYSVYHKGYMLLKSTNVTK